MAGITEQERTLQDVRMSADAAGLISCGPVQMLQFSNNCMSEEYKLLELPPKLLERLQQGESLIIRGENQEDAVLCTQDSTYDLKLADTSNALLLTPECQTIKDEDFVTRLFDLTIGFKDQGSDLVYQQVCSCHSEYFEVRQARPQLNKLQNLLKESIFKGTEFEHSGKNCQATNLKKYSFGELLDLVQGSEKEIQESLEKLGATQINGFWRLLDVDYEGKVVISILTLLEEKDWSWKKVPCKECCDILQELEPREIIEHCLDRYGEATIVQDEDNQGTVYYALNEDKICQFYAEHLLRPTDRFNYYEFMVSWEQSVPLGMTTKPEHLAGLAITDMKSHPPVIWHFPQYDLPEKTDLRFAKLFRTRSKWTFDEIQPYIRDLVYSGQSLNALLLKYSRSSKDDMGNKVYSSKKPL